MAEKDQTKKTFAEIFGLNPTDMVEDFAGQLVPPPPKPIVQPSEGKKKGKEE